MKSKREDSSTIRKLKLKTQCSVSSEELDTNFGKMSSNGDTDSFK